MASPCSTIRNFDTLNAAELAGVLAHEVMHPAFQHHTRRGDRERKRWNMACDYAIHPLLQEAGLALPKNILIDHRFHGVAPSAIRANHSNGTGLAPALVVSIFSYLMDSHAATEDRR
jgi:hypothetical protein